ncbi:amino acid racemase [Candidatus Kaiserbacteria bacterium]|nr:amino acid racemase [Candidatus Kaiserbacteria bacterium]
MESKVIGILGGLGPETTAHFYLDIISSLKEQGVFARPPIVAWSVPLPYALERTFITEGGGKDEYLSFLVDGCQRIERAGADFIVIPCNSVHIFIQELRQRVQIPVLSIVEETREFLRGAGLEKIVLLATTPTIEGDLYQTVLEQSGVRVKIPDAGQQAILNRVIQRLAASEADETDAKSFHNILESFLRTGTATILLACTDLQLLAEKEAEPMRVYDTINILVQATVRKWNNVH